MAHHNENPLTKENEMKRSITNFITEMTLFLAWGLLMLFTIVGGTAWLLSTL